MTRFHAHKRAWPIRLGVGAVLTALLLCINGISTVAAAGLNMRTDYPGITVKAGDSISFSISFDNDSGVAYNASLRSSSRHPFSCYRSNQRHPTT